MAKNSESSSKKKKNSVCEKIFRAVTGPVRTVRRISTTAEAAVSVKFSEAPTQAAKPITKMEPEKTLITRVETTLKTDERFTDYIKKSKLKMRAMTILGDTKRNDASETSETETRGHHHHHIPISRVSRESSSGRSSDRFSEYIKKARMKLRSSSTTARANPTYDSFKD